MKDGGMIIRFLEIYYENMRRINIVEQIPRAVNDWHTMTFMEKKRNELFEEKKKKKKSSLKKAAQ